MTERRFLPEGYLIGTRDNSIHTSSPDELERAFERGTVLESTVLRCDASDMSLHLNMGGMRGIVPRDEALYTPTGGVKDIAIITRVGKPISFVIKGFAKIGGEKVAVLSRRAVQERCMREHISRLTPGDIIPVRVTHLEPFGAFVDIGCGIVSLASVDTLSVSRISHPSDRLSVGDKLMAVVRCVDREAGRIYMSIRELLGTWEENARMFEPSQTVTGIVRSVEDYGIFVELSPNLAGLAEYRPGVMPGDGCAVYIKSMIPERMKVKLVMIDAYSEPVRHEMRSFVDTSRVTHMKRWQYSPDCCHKVIETVFE
ncbi:MAG: S1 RNA-binding domain-containing protein [Ruminococcaceae bacterium]|nr:S1 RNA-binding domain-containing protein [Oscillospiraceae bacterium]